jgi:S-adenosylmethionine uptake transporter
VPRFQPYLPFAATALGIATFSLMDAAMKSASLAVGVFTALLLRCTIGAAIMLPVWLLGGARWPAPAVLRVHVIRSLVAAAMATLFFWGLVRTPIAEAIALSFIGRQAIVAALLGLVGVGIIALAPGHPSAQPRSALGIAAILASAVLYAWNLVIQRQQAQAASPREIAFFQNFLVGAILSLGAPWFLQWPDAASLATITAAAGLVAISLMLLSWAYARAEAQALLPLEYTGFLWAALFGWVWFDERVTPATLAGAALIVIGCLIATRTRIGQDAP